MELDAQNFANSFEAREVLTEMLLSVGMEKIGK
jgi:hypothetical protein